MNGNSVQIMCNYIVTFFCQIIIWACFRHFAVLFRIWRDYLYFKQSQAFEFGTNGFSELICRNTNIVYSTLSVLHAATLIEQDELYTFSSTTTNRQSDTNLNASAVDTTYDSFVRLKREQCSAHIHRTTSHWQRVHICKSSRRLLWYLANQTRKKRKLQMHGGAKNEPV